MPTISRPLPRGLLRDRGDPVGYALIGVRVGLRFTRASLRSIARLLPLATALIVAVIATTPGGLFAVLATAADSGSDVTYVLTVQVIRVFAMLLFAPLLGRFLRRAPPT